MKPIKNQFWLIVSVILFTACNTAGIKSEKPDSIPDRLKWFNNAKFGMIIHWGPYAGKVDDASWPVMLNQISEEEYSKFPETFNPGKFNPDEWVKLAQVAGQRYMVFTAKHTDGFCMFDTKLLNSLFPQVYQQNHQELT